MTITLRNTSVYVWEIILLYKIKSFVLVGVSIIIDLDKFNGLRCSNFSWQVVSWNNRTLTEEIAPQR